MRQLLYDALVGTGVADDRVYATGSLGFQDIPANPQPLYIVVNQLQPHLHKEVWKTGRSTSHRFQLFFYGEPGSFVGIDEAMAVVRETVLGLTLSVSPSGAVCTQADWLSESGDVPDAEQKLNVKFAIISLLSNQ